LETIKVTYIEKRDETPFYKAKQKETEEGARNRKGVAHVAHV